MVKEFYANAIYEWDELKCWVRGKDFTVTPSYLAIILNINQLVFRKPSMYDDLDPKANLLQETFGENLDFSPNEKSISVSSLSPELRLLTTIMSHNLYPLSSTGYMNLGRALFLHDCGENCLPFCCLISKNLKLKGVHPLAIEYPYPKQVQSTFTFSMLASVIAEEESSKRVLLNIVIHALPHIPMMRS